ncbi:MAG TPA: hypothetical protein VLS88_01280, partial [Polyangiales bacterium]|nr:hypothetical protein [Polyangiales bacterium]
GSANWDPRSLRLNFEFNLECYDEALGRGLLDQAREKMKDARVLTLEELDRRSPFQQLRDGTARLMQPYL